MTLIYFILLLGFIIFIHELGHFLMARRSGVRVDKFSLGMGPKIAGFKRGDTEYILSALPFGGYVKMAGEDQGSMSGIAGAFSSKSVWQRIKITAAGPIANIIFPFLIMPVVFLIGTQADPPAKIGHMDSGSAALKEGFLPGDKITDINQRPIGSWADANAALSATNVPVTGIVITVERNQGSMSFLMSRESAEAFKKGTFDIPPALPIEVSKVRADLPAGKAGIAETDQILTANGVNLYDWAQFLDIVRSSQGKEVVLGIKSNNALMSVKVAPQEHNGKYVVGIEHKVHQQIMRYGFADSMVLGFKKTVGSINMTLFTLKSLFASVFNIKSVGGPVMIAEMSGQAATSGLSAYLTLMAIVSISLGVFNLLPIPVLDGGRILFYVIEAIRNKPLNDKVINISNKIGAVVLISMIALITFNDLARVITK